MSQLSIGVAGLGHGRTLLGANQPENSPLPVRVTALCDTRQDKLEALGREFGIDALTSDFDELVARSDLDIIGIYTPGPLHAQQILTALDAGKHVMVTKSMVYTMEEVEQVVEAVDRSGKVLLVTQSLRGRYDFMEAKRACDAGEIGELFMAESHYVHDLRPVYDYSPWRVEMPARPDLGRCLPPNRPSALVHGRYRRSPLLRVAQRRCADLSPRGQLRHQREVYIRQDRTHCELSRHCTSA